MAKPLFSILFFLGLCGSGSAQSLFEEIGGVNSPFYPTPGQQIQKPLDPYGDFRPGQLYPVPGFDVPDGSSKPGGQGFDNGPIFQADTGFCEICRQFPTLEGCVEALKTCGDSDSLIVP